MNKCEERLMRFEKGEDIDVLKCKYYDYIKVNIDQKS